MVNFLIEKANNIEYFIEGVSEVCNDKNVIIEKVKDRLGNEYSKLIDYLLLLKTEKFNAKGLVAALNNRDLEIIPWTYKTEIHHEFFFAKCRREFFCEGFVFRL